MTKAKFERRASNYIGTIGHVDHGKTSLLAAVTAALAPRPPTPDRVAVWNYDEFSRELRKCEPYVKGSASAKAVDVFMGLAIITDEALAPGTVELRNGKEVIRIINLTVN